MPAPIPANLHQFLREHIGSIVQLELLLILHADSARTWTVEEAAKKLYIGMSMTEPFLEKLRAAGLVVLEESGGRRYRFAAKSVELSQLVDELAKLYRERPVSTVNAIYAIPTEKLQNFADAFRIRKKEDK